MYWSHPIHHRPIPYNTPVNAYQVNNVEIQAAEIEEIWKTADQRMFPELDAPKQPEPPTIDEENLSPQELTALHNLLREFQNLFSPDLKNRARCTVTLHKIETGDAP